MQTGVLCKSQLPVYYTSWDLNMIATGGMQPSNNVDRMLMTRQYHNGAVASPFSGKNFECNYKDLVKHTMLKQEAILRDQVYQLHHLYKRQRESMDRLRANSNSDYSILPLHSVETNRLQESTYLASVEEGSFRKSMYNESKCQKFSKKKLDLELPAYEYLDSEEEEFSKVDVIDKDQSDSSTDCDIRKHNRTINSFTSKANFLVDLNVPLNYEEEVIEGIPNINLEFDCERLVGCKVIIDLNSSIYEDGNLSMPTRSIEMDLEAPASPENKESLPTRRESDGNQVETPPFSSARDVDLQEELVSIAAEAIVSISSSSVIRSSDFDSLYWFANVASSIVDDPDSVCGFCTNVHVVDNDVCLTRETDYFEAMTLQLEETKVDEYCSKETKKEEKNAASLPVKTRTGRTRRARQQREDFQSEILPSLASLSRHEVTEDLQLIEGLMEAAGDGSGRCGGTRGRRRSNSYASKMESRRCLVLKNNGDAQVGILERIRIDWGKITRRPRGSRIPSSNRWLRS